MLLLNPDLELTQTELARRVGASLSSVVDEVRRLEQAGLLSSRTLGRARLVRAGSGPLVEALAEVMLRAFGPLQIIAEEFGAAVADLDEAVTELRCSDLGRRAIAANREPSRRTSTSSS